MDHGEAVAMLSSYASGFLTKKKWADLGCGSGTFTLALAQLLPEGALIHAVDKDGDALDKIPDQFQKVSIEKHIMDFENAIPFGKLDGILMANALHFVKDKSVFVAKLRNELTFRGCILLVEYDLAKRNPWIPYPLTFAQTKELFAESGFHVFNKLNERPSRYNRAQMYSAVALQDAG